MAYRIVLRQDTAANWTKYNPLLLNGEFGFEEDTDKLKLGDGVHKWRDLPYWTPGPTGPAGSSGTSGTSGSSGTSGTSGTSGSSGTSGVDGTSGTSGVNGTSGTSGSAGTSGTSGTSGITGTSGTSGVNGTSGTSGVNGTSGTSGSAGTSGTSGTSGITGTSGTSGVNGTSGTSGTSGETGATGPQGDTGSTGPQGETGATGPQGDVGSTGPQGDVGPTGTTGATGAQGPVGAGGANGYYGSFYDTADQPIAAINTAQVVGINSQFGANGISVQNGSEITIANVGTYKFTAVLQVSNTSNATQYATFWLRLNGVDYANSGTNVLLQPRKSSSEPYTDLVTIDYIGTTQSSNDYIEIWWDSESTDVSLQYTAVTATEPAIPSIICGISQVMYLQTGPTGATGPQGATGATGSFVSPYTGNVQINGQSWTSAEANGNTTSSTTVDWDDSNVQTFTLNSATTTFTFSNGNAGATYILVIRQNSAGSQTITWPAAVTWSGGSTPTMTPTANRYDVYTFIYDGSKYFGSYIQNFT